MSSALQIVGAAVIAPPAVYDPFADAPKLEAFTVVPQRCGVAELRGEVVIYDPDILHREPIEVGAFYVRETQRPASSMDWQHWLRMEASDPDARLRAGPRGPLVTRREVIQAIHWPYPGQWSRRLPCGSVDGPIYDWAFGYDFVGKVIGLFRPGRVGE